MLTILNVNITVAKLFFWKLYEFESCSLSIHFVLMAGTRTLFLEFLTLDESNFKLNNFSNNSFS